MLRMYNTYTSRIRLQRVKLKALSTSYNKFSSVERVFHLVATVYMVFSSSQRCVLCGACCWCYAVLVVDKQPESTEGATIRPRHCLGANSNPARECHCIHNPPFFSQQF